MDSRTKNTKRNIFAVMLTNGFELIMRFLIRTAILYTLGKEYLGLSSLFTSILAVLNMADIGFSGAIIYSMYKPVADGDVATVCALLNYYKRIYSIVGMILLVTGSVITPAVPFLIKDTWPKEINIYFLYFMYLLDSSVSYFLYAYKEALLRVAQRLDVAKIIHACTHFGKYVFQFATLFSFKNYYLFMAVSIVGTLANNLVVKIYTDRAYPQYQCKGEVTDALKKDIKKQVGGLMVGKVSAVSRNSFDSIILSSTLGLMTVAVYDNYHFISSGIFVVLNYITQAMQASIGNSIAEDTPQKNFNDLKKFHFIYSWIVCIATTCLICLYQPVMRIWAGEGMLLSEADMTLFCLSFYITNLSGIIDLYFAGNGLWWRGKMFYFLEAGGNLLLNIFLGHIWGVMGILIATNVTMLFFRFFPVLIITFRYYFRSGLFTYSLEVFELAVVAAVSSVLASVLNAGVNVGGVWLDLIVRLLICFLVSNALMLICFYRSKEFKSAVATLRASINE